MIASQVFPVRSLALVVPVSCVRLHRKVFVAQLKCLIIIIIYKTKCQSFGKKQTHDAMLVRSARQNHVNSRKKKNIVFCEKLQNEYNFSLKYISLFLFVSFFSAGCLIFNSFGSN